MQRQLPAWRKAMKTCLGGDDSIFVMSVHGNSTTAMRSAELWKRCLQQPSVSTLGLLVLLLRWSHAKREQGGLVGPDNCRLQAPSIIFEQLVDVVQVAGADRFPLKVEVGNSWSCRWPRPQPFDSVYLTVWLVRERDDGKLALQLHEVKTMGTGRRKNPIVAAWWKALGSEETDLGAECQVLLMRALGRLAASKACATLLGQLCWHLSRLVERAFTISLGRADGNAGKRTPHQSRCTIAWDGVADAPAGAWLLHFEHIND